MNTPTVGCIKSDEAIVAWGLDHAGQSLGKPANGHTVPFRWPNSLEPTLATPAVGALSPALGGWHQPDQFETLLLSFLPEIARMPVEEAERETELALRRACEFLGLEWAALWRKSADDPVSLVPIHCFPGGSTWAGHLRSAVSGVNKPRPQTAAAVNPLESVYPWITAEVQRGNVVAFCQIDNLPAEAAQDKAGLLSLGVRSAVIIPFCTEKDVVGALSFGMKTGERCWPELLVKRLRALAGLFAQLAGRKLCEEQLQAREAQLKLANEEITQLKDQLQADDRLPELQLEPVQSHERIVGRSPGIMKVLRQVEQVATSDCSVLITGATGTGKELIAQEIHELSARKARALVLVNCAALPSELVESELFGRERGAYTGAFTSQVGRFELANRSTIFLDEVGELSMAVQAKLLRVLQQGEFQRLGSPKTHKVDVRVIAATNRELAAEVRRGKFREDLYYRLRVFPIELPPLNARAEDIPALMFAFLEEFATKMGKKITRVLRKDMELLQSHPWPGNIRELRNVIEHSVIVTAGDTLNLTLLSESAMREAPVATLAEAEREHILKTLESTRWRIKGPYGAAARLDMQPSTLYSRMQKLGIPHRRQKDNIRTAS